MGRDRQREGKGEETEVETVGAYGICLQSYRWALMLSLALPSQDPDVSSNCSTICPFPLPASSLRLSSQRRRNPPMHIALLHYTCRNQPFFSKSVQPAYTVTVSLLCTHYAVSWVLLKAIKPRRAQVWFKLT